MAKFFHSRNNGVVAVIREDDAKLYGAVKKSGGDPFKVGVLVFTFCDSERMVKELGVFTGDHWFLERLMRNSDHVLSDRLSETGWDGNVPFSNQEHQMSPHGDWRKQITSAADVVEKFELLK